MLGQLLLHYRVVEKIGEGGQGTVYKVIDTTLDRPAVIKVLPPDLTDSPSNLARGDALSNVVISSFASGAAKVQ